MWPSHPAVRARDDVGVVVQGWWDQPGQGRRPHRSKCGSSSVVLTREESESKKKWEFKWACPFHRDGSMAKKVNVWQICGA